MNKLRALVPLALCLLATAASAEDPAVMRPRFQDGIVGPDTWGQLVEAGFRLGDRNGMFEMRGQRAIS